MASEEHKLLSQFLKQVHSDLRISTSKLGAEKAWQEHCKNKDKLKTYALCMERLATTHWQRNCSNDKSEAICRINWVASFCYDYFLNNSYKRFCDREINIGLKINLTLLNEEAAKEPIKVVDVGSCYNPFKFYSFMDVLPIDLCPANESVLQCDFLNVPIGSDTLVENSKLIQLQETTYDVVSFCFLLEYIPDSKLRIKACENAYKILKPGGLLVISTPDSKHVGANSKIMKCWRYTLALMGFSRIYYEKFKHMHCLAFRKSLHKDIAVRWAHLYKEPFMEYAIHIPQDFNDVSSNYLLDTNNVTIKTDSEDFKEMPFHEFIDTSTEVENGLILGGF